MTQRRQHSQAKQKKIIKPAIEDSELQFRMES